MRRKIQMQVILSKQNKLVKAKIHKKTESETIQVEVIAKNVCAEGNNNMKTVSVQQHQSTRKTILKMVTAKQHL